MIFPTCLLSDLDAVLCKGLVLNVSLFNGMMSNHVNGRTVNMVQQLMLGKAKYCTKIRLQIQMS